jgi:hypothetical protein
LNTGLASRKAAVFSSEKTIGAGMAPDAIEQKTQSVTTAR